jgi:hypothetical protein
MGARLHETFVAAGLPEPTLRLESVVGAGAGAAACLDLVSDLLPIVLPAMERQGIATAAEVGLDTLSARLHAEAAAGSMIFGRSEIGAWTRILDGTPEVAAQPVAQAERQIELVATFASSAVMPSPVSFFTAWPSDATTMSAWVAARALSISLGASP